MPALFLLEVYCRWYQRLLYLSINKGGRRKNLLHVSLRREVPSLNSTRLPVERERVCRLAHLLHFRKASSGAA